MDRLGGIFGSQEGPDEEPDFSIGEDDVTDDCLPPPIGQDERRMQVRAYNQWAAVLGERNFPSIDELDLAEEADFGPYSVLLDFSEGIDNPVIRHLGRALAEECGEDGDIDALEDVPSRSLLSRITDHYLQILANRAPIGFEAEFVNRRDRTTLYRGILLPYSSDDQTIDFVFGVINWKELADQQTADELLLEIGQALGAEPAEREEELEPVAASPSTGVTDAEDAQPQPKGGRIELPVPAFGETADDSIADEVDGDYGDFPEWDSKPIGETAKDYGLDDDYDEPEPEDVDEVVDPLADESVGSGLSALIGRSARTRESIDLSAANPSFEASDDTEDAALPVVPEAYEPEDTDSEALAVEPFAEVRSDAENEETSQPFVEPEHAPATGEAEPASPPPEGEDGEGLHDALAIARECADIARSSEDRSRAALYDAVGRAYDFSLEAQQDREAFEELVAENGLKVQDRAPMTPVVKLVFGIDYDKSRLTEYAAVLSHAHRLGIARGTLPSFLGEAEGGLKGVVKAERQARREDAGAQQPETPKVRDALAEKLRTLEPVSLDGLEGEGPEFALVMVRRAEDGSLEILGEIPEDIPLVERGARKLLG